jgi:surface protein
MFSCCYKLESVDISAFDLTNAEDISSLFCDCKRLKTVDLCSFDTSNVKDMKSMFENCYSLETITVSEKWTTSDDSGKMFLNCDSLVGGNGTVFDEHHTDGEYARIDGGSSNPGYFTYKEFKDWKSLPFD